MLKNSKTEVPKIMRAIRLIGEGRTVSEAIDETKISSWHWHKWTKTEPLNSLLQEALQRSYDVMAEMLVNIDKHHAEPAMASVISKNIQWFLSRRRPQTYGDRAILEHHITASKEVIEALTRARERAQALEPFVARALPHPTRYERLNENHIDRGDPWVYTMDVVDVELEPETDEEAELAKLY
jgi:hypothetical protein